MRKVTDGMAIIKVSDILKKRFPNLTTSETVRLAVSISEALVDCYKETE